MTKNDQDEYKPTELEVRTAFFIGIFFLFTYWRGIEAVIGGQATHVEPITFLSAFAMIFTLRATNFKWFWQLPVWGMIAFAAILDWVTT